MWPRRLHAALTGAAALLAAAGGRAEGGFNLNKFEPSPAGDVFVSVPSPFASGHLEVRGHAVFDYAHTPIRVVGGNIALVSAQAFMRLDTSLALWDRLLISVGMPFALLQDGDDPAIPGTSVTDLRPSPGDLRLGVRARAYGEERSPFQLGVGGYLFVPTGDAEQYTGDGSVRVQPHLVAGGRIGGWLGFAYSAMAGVELHTAELPQNVVYGAAAALLLAEGQLQVGPELHGASALPGSALPLSATPQSPATTVAPGTNLELLVSAKVRLMRGLTFGAGIGPGLLDAIGTPTFRAVGMLGWAPLAGSRDDEPAEERPEPESDFLDFGVADSDGDGIADDIDACPDVPGVPSADPAIDGCPSDS